MGTSNTNDKIDANDHPAQPKVWVAPRVEELPMSEIENNFITLGGADFGFYTGS